MKSSFKNITLSFLAIVLFAVILTSCDTGIEKTTATTTVITDQLGRTVTLGSTAPQRIVSLSPSNTEILFALGLDERIAGVTDYCNYPPEAKDKPSVGAYDTPNFEQLIALNPDLVLATEEHETDIIPQLESNGITVIGLKPKCVSEVMDSILLIGKVTGKNKEAANLTKDLQERIRRVTNKTENLPDSMKPRVFYIIWHDPLWTVGSGTMHDELISMAGGVNIAHDLTWYANISLEAVIEANPEIIIAGVGMGSGEDAPYQFVLNEPTLKGTDALKNNNISTVDMDIVSRPGPRIVDALEDFLAIIHPELRDQPN
jgi:iron complex transport system substrate-binding protein